MLSDYLTNFHFYFLAFAAIGKSFGGEDETVQDYEKVALFVLKARIIS